MGFTIEGKQTERKTHHLRTDVIKFRDDFSDEKGWKKYDVVNRALLYYRYKLSEGKLDDPVIHKSMSLGFTTRGKETERKTHKFRKDNLDFIDDMNDERGWGKSDVVNRAMMYYANKWRNNDLDDPRANDNIEDNIEDITSGKKRLRDLL